MADDDANVERPVVRSCMADRRHPLHVFAGRLTAVLDELTAASAGPSLLPMTGPGVVRDVRPATTLAPERTR